MVGSSPDNGETGRYCQTARARQARRKGATKVNQWLNSLKQDAGSNLVDVGRRQRTPPAMCGVATSKPISAVGQEVPRKVCGVLGAMLQGKSWAPTPSTDSW